MVCSILMSCFLGLLEALNIQSRGLKYIDRSTSGNLEAQGEPIRIKPIFQIYSFRGIFFEADDAIEIFRDTCSHNTECWFLLLVERRKGGG